MIDDIIEDIEQATSYISDALFSVDEACSAAQYARDFAENADSVLDGIRESVSRLEEQGNGQERAALLEIKRIVLGLGI